MRGTGLCVAGNCTLRNGGRCTVSKRQTYISVTCTSTTGKQTQPLNTKRMETLPGVSRLWLHHLFHLGHLHLFLHSPSFLHHFLHRVSRLIKLRRHHPSHPSPSRWRYGEPSDIVLGCSKISCYPVTTEWAPVIHNISPGRSCVNAV